MDKAKPPSSAKAAFAKLTSRPVNLPVSSFSFRFNPADEETLEELQDSATDGTKSSSRSSSKKSSRNMSLDDASPDGRDGCPETQTWSFLSEIKGKIARTMEEKFHIDIHGGNSNSSFVAGRKTSDVLDTATGSEEKPATDDKQTDDEVPSAEDVPPELEQDGLRHRPQTLESESFPSSNESFSNASSSEQNDTTTTDVPQTRFDGRTFAMYCKIAVMILLGLACAWLPLPAYGSGFLTGCLFVIGVLLLGLRFIGLPYRVVIVQRASLSSMQSSDLPVPTCKPVIGPKKVWMNELLGGYVPEHFHINQTQSVFARLEGSVLRLSYPKGKVPKKAMWDEPAFDETFVHQRHYELRGAEVKLLPEKLARRRYWVRKYPIFIRLAEDAKVVDISAPAHLTKTREGSLTLFTRTGRDKEEWFRLLDAASKCCVTSQSLLRSEPDFCEDRQYQEYWVHLYRIISTPISESIESIESSGKVTWLNALLVCGLWGFMRDGQGALVIKEKMQKKLGMLKIPYFVDGLRITDLELGADLPHISSISSPTLNDRGLWVDFDMSYYGAFHMTLETKLNLMKLKCGMEASNSNGSSQETFDSRTAGAMYDSDADDSGESSSDDESIEVASEAGGGGGGGSDDSASQPGCLPAAGRHTEATSKRLLRFVDTIAQSRYFQQATEYKYVKRAIEGVSNTRLILSVEVLSLVGTLTINIPPPPSDRIWYGFRGNPQLIVVAKPKVGEREVNLTNIVEWIESKLILEFQRVFVLPNMDDLIIPFTKAGLEAPRSSADLTPSTPPPEPPKDKH